MTVVVSDPHKVGEGMSSYMAYRVSTRYRAAFSGVGGVGGEDMSSYMFYS